MPKYCSACSRAFEPSPQVPRQSFCSAPECQRERRRRWQREKLASDPDYRENQARSQKNWAKEHPDYWREYRQSHPEYAELNRTKQHSRNRKRQEPPIAKMDVSTAPMGLPSGRYLLKPMANSEFAKMDAWIVEITVLSAASEHRDDNCKERT